MSAVGVKPIVEIQFADYVWTGMNQLVCEITKSSYLTMGKYPVSAVIRIPIGAYGGGGPYHSGSIESTLLTLKGIKIAYPSNAADMKGLMKAAYYDGNPCIMLEHKGLYWSKNPGPELARCIEPDEDYVLPFGKANIVLEADEDAIENGESCSVITYGMGVYWALGAAKNYPGKVEVVDLRSLQPLDEETIMNSVKKHGKCLVLTEEPLLNSFAESLAARIMQQCFQQLDAPVATLGAKNVPAIPMNMGLEAEILPNTEKVSIRIGELLQA
jgi:2-oxoisovalerate dehydrogenase E1 component